MHLITSNFVPALTERFSGVSSSIALCFYSASAPLKQHNNAFKSLWSALLAAHARSCKIRLLFDHHAGGTAFSAHVSKQIINFRAVPFPVRFISNKKKLHSKFAIFDADWFYLGSHNFTPSGVASNFETGIVARNPLIAQRLLDNFNYLWGLAHVG